jgi:hypothetical protein
METGKVTKIFGERGFGFAKDGYGPVACGFPREAAAHDDIVLAVAISVWFSCHRPFSSIEPLPF